MKRIYLLLMLVISFATVYGQSTEAPYSVTLGEFTQLRIRHGIPVDYVCSNDSSGLITFTGTKELTEALTFDLTTKGKLTISLEPRNFDGKIGRVTVRSRQLVSVENEGDSAVRVLGINSCPVFKAKQTGNGTISVRDITANQVEISTKLGHGAVTVNGSCELAKLNCTGTGAISAGDLVAKDIKCTLFGTGNIDCNVSGVLSVTGAGSGTILYTGTPTEIKSKSAGIKLVPIDSK